MRKNVMWSKVEKCGGKWVKMEEKICVVSISPEIFYY
jgi:hypothetical protein